MAEKSGLRQEAADPTAFELEFTAYPVSIPLLEARLRVFGEGWDAAASHYVPIIAQLEHSADRLYAEVCRRTPPKHVDPLPFAKLEQLRDKIYAGTN